MTTPHAVRLERGPKTLLSPLARDPWWPTRHPVGFAARALVGRGRPRPLPPGPVGVPAVGVWPWHSRQPHQYLQHCARRYGDVFRLPLPLVDVVFLSHPDHAAHVLNDRAGYGVAGPFEPIVRRTVGVSVVWAEGEHSQRRAMLMLMFGRRHLARIADTIVDEFAGRIDSWERWADTGAVVDLQPELAKVILPAFLRSMFSATITDEQIAEIDADIQILTRLTAITTLAYPPPNLVPLPGIPSVPAAFVRLRRTIGRLIAHRRANPIEGSDLLDALLGAHYSDGSPLSSRDLKVELIALIIAGYDTLVASLSWTLGLLSQHADPAETLYGEIDELGGARPTFADLAHLAWAKACFDEGQRLQGNQLFQPRLALEDNEIGGYSIPRSTVLGIPVHTIHRDPRWWPDPDRYDPTRFTDQRLIEARPKLAFQPFGAGPHRCIGSEMAYMNAQFLLALIFQRYRLHTPRGWVPRQHSATLITGLEGGLPVTITRSGTARKSR
ncbi:cytochrome P450 [Nocardia crassostreae]|uniref:cytochrome P450 n=1 Tax=Nocardia crassostreae TaxID=53428 RepID=UPI000A03E190|nr:cytochrome P450 [Nocardia crassostreae]